MDTDDGDIPPFIPPDDSDDDLLEVQATVAVPPSPPPPRKRARTTNFEMGPSELEEPRRNNGPPVRDEVYYMSDGSCVLLVDNTLFNVHRTILSRDSSFFGDLFAVPQGETALEGTSDENPIQLHGETVSEFRNFLWVLYALPHQVLTMSSDSSSLPRLTDVARVANKYAFRSLETWALDSIVDVINRRSTTTTHFGIPSPYVETPIDKEQIVVLVRLAQMCSHENLLNSMVSALRKLMPLSPQNAYLALALADELGLRQLQGEAYLEVLLKHFPRVAVIRSDYPKQLGEFDEQGRLLITPSQQLRLLVGHHRLATLWESIRAQPLPFEHAPSCELNWQKSSCVQSWLEFWRDKTRSEAVLSKGLADVVSRLTVVAKEFERIGTPTMMHHDCRGIVRKAIGDKIREVQSTLPDQFSDSF